MPVLAGDLLRRKKEQVFVAGYEIDSTQSAGGSVAAGEDVFNFFGTEDTLADVTVNNGRLSLAVFDKKANNVILDVLTYKDPTNTADRRYNWEEIKDVSVWINRKEPDNLTYNRGSIYKNWLPVPGMTAGDVTGRGTRTFEGNCDVPLEFNQPVRGVKVRLRSGAGTTPNFQAEFDRSFLQIPGAETGIYAIQLFALNEQRVGSVAMPSKFEIEELAMTTSMFSGSGLALNLRQADLKILSWMTHAYVVGIYNRDSGVFPTVRQYGLLESIT